MTDRKPLTHTRQAETAKPEAKPYTLNAGDSLFLKVMPNGTKKWFWRYFYLNTAKTLSMRGVRGQSKGSSGSEFGVRVTTPRSSGSE